MKTKRFDIPLMLLAVLALCGLSACGDTGMYHESYLTPNRIQVEKGVYSQQIPVAEMNEPFLDVVAREYDKKGKGPLDLTVTYDPQSRTNTAAKATATASSLAGILNRYGVRDQNVSVMPVNGQGNAAIVFVDFISYDALPPKDCTLMSGMNERQVEARPEYRLGCTVDTVLTMQLARPKDIAGQGTEDRLTDGRRSTRIVEIYRQGSKDDPLQGESSSGL